MEDFKAGPDAVQKNFAAVAPWARTAVQPETLGVSGSVRASTCFLIDDYFSQFLTPAEVIPQVLEAAKNVGLQIDYLALESSCALASGIEPARLVLGRLVTEPSEGTTGDRPPVADTGWLSNGDLFPGQLTGYHAMAFDRGNPHWEPPRESSARRHSIYVDVELWTDADGTRTWSCPMLAAVWQLLRLGLLRHEGGPAVTPTDWAGSWPDSWDEMPAITRLHSSAAPFAAYSTVSVLSPRFLPVELAVRTILGQFMGEPSVLEQVSRRAGGERFFLPDELVDRIRYVFAGSARSDRP
jgi:hypothetical protein